MFSLSRAALKGLECNSPVVLLERIAPLTRRFVQAAPVARSVATGMALVGTADVACQKIESPASGLDLKRTARFLMWGAAFNGVVFHMWYQKYLPRLMARLANTAPVRRYPVGMKILIDQMCLSPLLYVAFPVFHGVAEGKDLAKVFEKTGNMWWRIALGDWTVYPAVQAVNFSMVPAAHHTVVVQATSLIFNVGMSYVNRLCC